MNGEYTAQYAQKLAKDQGLKWHQEPDKMYAHDRPFVLMNRELKTGEIVTIRYRGFDPREDKMIAGPEGNGIDFAMYMHQARFGGIITEEYLKAAAQDWTARTGEIIDLDDPRFKLDQLRPLEDGVDFGLHE